MDIIVSVSLDEIIRENRGSNKFYVGDCYLGPYGERMFRAFSSRGQKVAINVAEKIRSAFSKD